jgi:predicted N-formylglutamate amidohydrolase
MNETSRRLLITCEHGGNRIPRRYHSFFLGAEAVRASHRGYDRGALPLARELARALGAPLIASTTSRLLVDLNRSPGHPRLFGETVRQAPPSLRHEILARYYRPYRRRAENLIAETVAEGQRIVHVSCHSFTPVLDGEVRKADVGLLYDPARPGEKALCAAWRIALLERLPDLKVRFNYPYAGTSDGFTAHLRRTFAPEDYVGIELEINQGLVGPRAVWRVLRGAVIESLQQALQLSGW